VDSTLTRLIEQTLLANRELEVAEANVKIASTSLARQTLETSYSTQSGSNINIGRNPAPNRNVVASLGGSLGASWEYDAFGRIAAAIKAAEPLLSIASSSSDIPTLQAPFAIGSPEELIRRRPDIRAAETDIARRLALSDVERSRLFPTLTFSTDISALFGAANRIDQLSSFGFGLGPAISWEGPDLRRVRADIDIADSQTQRAYKVYEQVVTQALSDVEVALASRQNEQRRREDLSLAADAAKTALDIATLRFEEGLDDFLDVLDAQRTLLTAQDRLAENQLQTTRLTVLAYRELGGL